MSLLLLDLILPMEPVAGDSVELVTGLPLVEHLRPLFAAPPTVELSGKAQVVHLTLGNGAAVDIDLDSWGHWGLSSPGNRLRLLLPSHRGGRAQRWLWAAGLQFSVRWLTELASVHLDLAPTEGDTFLVPVGLWGVGTMTVVSHAR